MNACAACRDRSFLLARLAPRIETIAGARGRGGSRELLALSDEDLLDAVGCSGERSPESGPPLEPEPSVASTCRHRWEYPATLGHLGDSAPHALWLRGDAGLLGRLADEPAVAIVGSRRATPYGREIAHELGMLLAGAGVLVVSGLAFGIDAAAHRGALDGGGPTVAVLGSGANVAYPASNRRLYERVVRSGLVVSEMPPGFTPFRWSFPARNRIMAALGAITVVVEAAERSGSLITVRMAQEIGRDVGVVPGPVNSRYSRASNALLADGALPVLGAQSVLDALFGPGAREPRRREPDLEPEHEAVLARVEAGETTPDSIARSTGLGAGAVAAALAVLELRGRLRADPAGRYVASGAGG